ncbi:MAG: hypothetical protein IJ192_12810 [Clostridia bacterium]|nr:hypothetical protein [Clostridia bacterium]
MNINKLRESILELISLHPNDDYGTENCWKEETEILSENISETINFFENQCTDEEFFWLSSVFSDVSEIVQSKQFVQTLRSRLTRVDRETYNQNSFESEHMRKWVDYDEYVRSVGMEIEYAEGALNEE